MPRNGSGTYTLPQAAFTPGTTISSSAVNSDFSDIASALTQSLSSDGQTPITGPLKQNSGILSSPTWTFTSDATSGMFLDGVGILGLVAGGFGILVDSTGSSAASATVSSAGSSYAVGDTITLTGGTTLRNTILTVATISGSGVGSVTVLDAGLYSTVPSNPVAQGSTSGSGSGATFTVTWSVADLISNAAGTALWQLMGASSFMAGAMTQVSGVALANYIGASSIIQAIQSAITPQGYLTSVSNTPIITSDSVSATVLYYTADYGNWLLVHNGTQIIPFQFSTQLSLTLTTSQAASNIYDIFVIYNSGTPVIGTGPSWSAGTGGSVTAGSCARGTGAGGTSLARFAGIWTNAVQISLIWNTGSGNTTVTVPVNQAVYLGSIFIDTSAGQITSHCSWGQSRKWSIWNMYQRRPLILKAGDSTSAWTPGSGPRPANNNAANNMTLFTGLPEEVYDIKYHQFSQLNSSANNSIQNGIGYNSTSAFTGTVGQMNFNVASSVVAVPLEAEYAQTAPPLGINVITALEAVPVAGSGWTYFGTEANMVLSSRWRG